MTKYCSECRWCKMPADGNPEYAECKSPRNAKELPAIHLVSRHAKAPAPIYKYCEVMRRSKIGDEDVCGTDGEWYEARLAVVS